MAGPDSRLIKKLRVYAGTQLNALPKPTASLSDIPEVIRDASSRHKLQTRVADESYGQGFGSFVDAWFYKDTADFRLKPLTPGEQHFIGLYILFSRLAPFYVMGEGAKSWSGRGGSSYLPDFEGTDRLTHPAVKHLSIQLDTFITSRGFVRLSKADVAPLLPDDLQFASNLSDGAPRLFDALFFWND